MIALAILALTASETESPVVFKSIDVNSDVDTKKHKPGVTSDPVYVVSGEGKKRAVAIDFTFKAVEKIK